MKNSGSLYLLFVVIVVALAFFLLLDFSPEKKLKEPTHLTKGILIKSSTENKLTGIYQQAIQYLFNVDGKYYYDWQLFEKNAQWIMEGNELTIRYEVENPDNSQIVSVQKKNIADHVLHLSGANKHERISLNNQLFILKKYNDQLDLQKVEYGIFSIQGDSLIVDLLHSNKSYYFLQDNDSVGNITLKEFGSGNIFTKVI